MLDKKYCCRLDQEFIMGVVRNRSGIDAGEIDMELRAGPFSRMSVGCLENAIKTLASLTRQVEQRLQYLKDGGDANASCFG